MVSTWWLNIKIIYCEKRRFILSPLAAGLHLKGKVVPFPFFNGYKIGELLPMGRDGEGRQVLLLLHGGYLSMIKNLTLSLHERVEFIELDRYYRGKIRAGLFLSFIFKEWGERLIQEGMKESIPFLGEKVKEERTP